jgi:hypothetical protein
MKSNKSLAASDITSQRTVSRRALLGTLGLGAGLAAAGALDGVKAQEKPTKRDPCRDTDRGIPNDTEGCGRPPTS